jgi:CheY-like chemotaxis protein
MAHEGATKKTILIVEDDHDTQQLLSRLLEQQGYEVALAADGREALAYLQSGKPVSLILLDLMMPVMDGWRFREEQLNDPALASIPVVVTTAVSRAYQREDTLKAAGYVPKPIEPKALLELVSESLSRGSAGA